MSNNLLDHFSNLKDPRIERKKLHQLPDIIFLAISATISLADGWEAIAEFGQYKLEWLRRGSVAKFFSLSDNLQILVIGSIDD